MKRIDHESATEASLFTDGDPETGAEATVVTAGWLNAVQEEIANAIEDADGGNTALDGNSTTQLKTAIKTIADARIAAAGLGEGGDASGRLVNFATATNGSNASTTSTSFVDVTSLTISHTKATAANAVWLDIFLDWEIKDTTGPKAEAFLDVLYNSGAGWASLKTYTFNFELPDGRMLVGSGISTLADEVSTTSQSEQTTGIQVNYTSVAAANKRFIDVYALHKTHDSTGGGANASVRLQYYNGSTWVTLKEYQNQQVAGGATSSLQQIPFYDTYEHDASDADPQYRLVHINNDSGNSSALAAGSYLRVREYSNAQLAKGHRAPIFISLRHSATDSTPEYKLQHKVTNGDTSTIYAGSLLQLREIN